MNYRHAFHAGNHADVLKHAVLARVVEYLALKDKPFAALDAHAGIGAYDLQSVEAGKTGEWQTGIGLMAEPFDPAVEAMLAAYRKAVAAMNPSGALRYYPGSPELILQGMRGGDRLIANELHPSDAATLEENYRSDRRLEVTTLDALQAVKSQLPLREKRGLVLIDPPYEERDEAEKVVQMLAQGQRRFAGGIFIIWYPVTTEAFVDRLLDGIHATGIGNILKAELRVKNTHEASGLSGSGLLILNPPFVLEDELRALLPALAIRLGVAGLGRQDVSWLTPKKG
ncbi:23S rRNA (adenine(2030)-N(6))-methyltransferase RlmJ [Aestuariivirga litoralis]|uniref:23S rRNA (adenine(2030)-N(6))-methyltransferase RlmJ n=1 Tax=Aestuariivirga litoralis TaxID=2650924 RepID=UPI0018C5F9C0|nr:23S rRNA (adenine(2030)-N(6))-methyltransferase RlmJ [Aestuariivirga litoralis]MBG1231023.1 23S rRNA (adenine(2030)-N(6))-methyltransferase RlmJ [Aestuariivirga litoralis]